MSTEDVLKAAEPWMQQCGRCDAGLPMDCTCPDGDPRLIVSRLAAEVERLRSTGACPACTERCAEERGEPAGEAR